MSQPDTQDKPPGETERKEPADILSEALFSGEEIEGLIEKKRREEMQANGGRKSGRKRGKNGVKDPLSILKERVAIYNKKKDSELGIAVEDEVSRIVVSQITSKAGYCSKFYWRVIATVCLL